MGGDQMPRSCISRKSFGVLVLAAAVALTSCSAASLTSVEMSMLGEWTLSQVNSKALPVNWGGVCGQDNQVLAGSNVAISGVMTFLAKNNEYQISLVYDSQCPGGAVIRNTTNGSGHWYASTADAVTINPGSGNISGTNSITAITNGRISFAASLPSIQGSAPNATPVVATLTFGR